MANTDVRYEIMKSGLKNYQVATMLGVTETTFSRWLRTELPTEKKQQILTAINENCEKSGITTDRPNWNSLIKRVKKDAKTNNIRPVFDEVSRMSRNAEEGLKKAAVQHTADTEKRTAKAKKDTVAVVTQSDEKQSTVVKPFKKPASDYYRLDLVKRQTVVKEKGKGNRVMIKDVDTDYREYLDSVRGTMSITAYIQALLDKDMKANKK